MVDDVAAVFAGAGADVEEVVGGSHDGFFVFDDEEGVSAVAEAVHDADEGVDVAGVKADGGFVEDEEGVGEGGAETGGEIDALHFAAGEGAGGAVEGEVAEADLLEVVESGGDFGEDESGGFVEVIVGGLEFVEPLGEVDDGELPEGGEGVAVDLEDEGGWLEPGATAFRALRVGAVAAEEDADVHLVGLAFHPVEEALYTIPLVVAPGVFGVVAFAVEDPFLVGFGQFVERDVAVEAAVAGLAEEIALAFLAAFALEGFHAAVGEGEGAVGDGFGEIDADDAAEPSAGGAGAEGVVEGEEGGGGWAAGKSGFGVAPGGGEGFQFVSFQLGALGTDGDVAFAEFEGTFEGFEEAGSRVGSEADAILDDVDLGGEEENVVGGIRIVGADDVSVEVESEVALLLEEGEEVGEVDFFGDRDGEEDEDLFPGKVGEAPIGDGVGRVGTDAFAAVWVDGVGVTGVEEFEVVVDLGDRADGRASGADVIFLLDGDGGRDAIDAVDRGFVHAVEELPDVGGECFDVASLSLGVESLEGEGGFAGAGGAGDDGEFPEGDVQRDVLEVVLSGADDADDLGVGGGLLLGRHAGELTREGAQV